MILKKKLKQFLVEHDVSPYAYAKEIEDFFKDELEGKSHLKEFVDSLMTKPNGFTLGLPSHYIVDGQEVIVNRRVQEVVIFHS